MIKSFKDQDLEDLYYSGTSARIKPSLINRLLRKLDMLDNANVVADLNSPPGNHLHPLKGEYQGYWAISVSGPWRILFRFANGNVYDIFLVQYH
jgi:proteic killer suppression protein